MFGEAAFLSEAFATYFTREGGRGGGVNNGDVIGQVTLPCVAFTTALMWTGKGRRSGRVDDVDVCGHMRSPYEAFTTYLASKGRGRVCVFVQQVATHGLLSCGGPLAKAAQEGGRAG